jgi:hypothetical protein
MAGQAARKSRSEVCAAMRKVDCTPQKKHATGGDPVAHPTKFGNPSLRMSGKTMTENKEIKIGNYC